MTKYYLAIDIGASSGRHIVGDEKGNLTEVYRFETGFYRDGEKLLNDVQKLAYNVIIGIKRAFEKFEKIESCAIDTWGVDYVLMKDGKPVLPVYAYRDERTLKVIDEVHRLIPFEKLYQKTGIQFQPFNTLYQLYADKISGRLDGVSDFLMLPEYLNYLLTGNTVKEYTNATTTGIVNAETGEFDSEIIAITGLLPHLFKKTAMPGTVVGELLPSVQSEVGGNLKVVLCASHDTASAVEGIPMDDNAPYISSGTWSLLGVKVEKAINDDGSRIANYSNEGGVGYTRYQKNIMGMWVVNELRRELCPDKHFEKIESEAPESPFSETVDVNDSAFFAPKSMKEAFDVKLGVKNLEEKDYFNCAFLSLAKSYRNAIDELESNTGKSYKKIYIVGGGAKNDYLNRLTEIFTGKKVVALPIEATAIGNLKIQMEDDK